MEEFLNFVSQNYFYIPASIIGALLIIIPAIVKIAKICTSNTANAIKLSNMKKEIENLKKELNETKDELTESLSQEISFLENSNKYELNKKQVALNNSKIGLLNGKIEKLKEKKIVIEEAPQPKKKVRIKVKK